MEFESAVNWPKNQPIHKWTLYVNKENFIIGGYL